MPQIPRFSKSVANDILQKRGLEGQVTPEQLAEKATGHDLHSPGYAARHELELAASEMAKVLGLTPGMEKAEGLRFDRKTLDKAKLDLREIGVFVDDDDLLRVVKKLDEGYGRASKAEVAEAVRIIGGAAILERAEQADPPPRATFQAEAPDATPDLRRRKLSDEFEYAGSGPVKVAFFDADSTLRVSKSGSVSANAPDDVALLPLVAERIKELEAEGYLIAIVSNQMGVQYGHVAMADADEALQRTADLIRAAGGNVHYVDYAEKRGDDRKPATGMVDRLDALLTDTFGGAAAIDRSTSVMVGDSSYKKTDTRPDGTPGTRFSNSDRLLADNAGLRFEEPGDSFGWVDYGRRDFDNLDERASFLADYKTGRRVHSSPLLTRLAQLDADTPTAASLQNRTIQMVRQSAGDTFPDLDQGYSGLQGFILDGADAERALAVAKGWQMGPQHAQAAAAIDYNPDQQLLLATLTHYDEPELSVWVIDKTSMEATRVGIDMNFVDATEDLLEQHVPESKNPADDSYDGFTALAHLLQGGDHILFGDDDEGVKQDFDIAGWKAF